MIGAVVDSDTKDLRRSSIEGGASSPSPEKKVFRDRPASEQAVSELNSEFDETRKNRLKGQLDDSDGSLIIEIKLLEVIACRLNNPHGFVPTSCDVFVG